MPNTPPFAAAANPTVSRCLVAQQKLKGERLAYYTYLAFVEVVNDLPAQSLFPLPLCLRWVVQELP
jgi:hypothetical protein